MLIGYLMGCQVSHTKPEHLRPQTLNPECNLLMPLGELDAGGCERACAMMLQLLTHRSGRVCSAVYGLLEEMVLGMRDSSVGQPLVQLLCAEVGWRGD